ncbi:MAG: glycosyltransferase [Candidatus Paceibacterota bacterium]
MLDEIQPDAVAINGWSVPEARAAATWCRRNRRLAILMSETFESSAQWWKEQVKRRRVRRFDAALVGGRWHADYLVSLGFPRNKIHVGYDAVDNAHFYAETSVRPSTHATETSKLQLPARYFFANTRFLPRKNIDGLLHAYSQYRADVRKKDAVCEPWHLVISGSGEMENAWKTLAMELGLSATVHWPGFLQYDELPFYYSNASAFVHVAHREAWGLVVNEAAAAGLPLIVGNRVGSTCELVRDGINGILVDSTDTAQLSKALLRIATLGDERRRAMGRVSRRLADAYGPERFGTACAKILGDRVCTP